jgi:ABC-type glycerol-3-phosphate transport system substrate-binding protein
MRIGKRMLVLGAVALVAAAGAAGVAAAQAQQQTPKSWNWTVDKDGKRVPKGNRTVKADGSWREEIRQGKCVTIKEKSATGEYRETQQCNPS